MTVLYLRWKKNYWKTSGVHIQKNLQQRCFPILRMVRCILWKYNIWLQSRWWWKEKNSFKCKNRKITFLVQLTEHIYCIFVCHNFSLLNKIWKMVFKCLLYFYILPLIKTFRIFPFARFLCFLHHHLFCYVMQ